MASKTFAFTFTAVSSLQNKRRYSFGAQPDVKKQKKVLRRAENDLEVKRSNPMSDTPSIQQACTMSA